MSEIDMKYIQKHLGHICRVCFALSKNLNHLSTKINVRYKSRPACLSIKTIIESVTKSTVLYSDKIPAQVCSICLNCLKIAFDFKEQFAKAQSILTQPFRIDLDSYETQNESNKDEIIEEIVLELANSNIENDTEQQCEREEIMVKTGSTYPKYIQENIITETDNIENEFDDETGQNDFEIIRRIFKCKICKRQYKNERRLKLHVQDIHNSQFLCEECGAQLFSKSAFEHHLRKHRGKIFKCNLCRKSYLTLSDLRAHKKSHTNERNYLCSACGKNFNYPESLRYHMRLHTGEKNYVCTVCGRKYRMKGTLTRHMRTHTKEKPYPCDFCSRQFATLFEKKSHEMAIHTGERPYKCEHCGKGFAKSGNLATHLQSHTGDYECELCCRTFIERKCLETHLKKKHSDLIDSDS